MSEHIHSSIKNQKLLTERRDALCNAAARLFRQYGFHKTTLPKIAKESGISVGSIYRYINRKEDIMVLMMDRIRKLLESKVYPIAEMSLPSFDKLFETIKSYYTIIDQNSDYFHIGLRDMKFISEFRDTLHQREDQTVTCFTSILQEGIDRKEFTPVPLKLFAYNIVMLGHTWILRSYHFEHLTIESYIQQQYNMMKRILTTDL